jgi:hypothetical protein
MITRYNYEEFFLLFVDNELSGAERKAVQEFIQQNPDLEAELVTLQQSVLKPESNICFENKDSLLKQMEENSLINQSNYQEYLLLYVDNELDHAAKKDVEQYIHENPFLQNDLSLLQQAILEPDTDIVFAGKETLYKKEQSKRRVLFGWMSAAAVAILLVTGFLFYNNTQYNTNKRTASVQGRKSNLIDSLLEKNKKQAVAVTLSHVDSFNNTQDITKQMQVAPLSTNNKKRNKKAGENNPEVVLTNSVPPPQLKAQLKIRRPLDVAKIHRGNDTGIDTKMIVSKLHPDPTSLIAKTEQPESDVTLVARVDTDFDYIDTDNTSANKNKLRGIFRRVSRVFEKTTNVDDGNKRSVSIGSFQIALK